jgi:uncharacterized membrane protein
MALAVGTLGVLHFATPDPFVQIMPRALPAPLFLVYLSGAIEIGLSAALLVPVERVQRLAAWGMAALFVAVFPANVNMAVNDIRLFDSPAWVAWARLPFQGVLVWFAVRLAQKRRSRELRAPDRS